MLLYAKSFSKMPQNDMKELIANCCDMLITFRKGDEDWEIFLYQYLTNVKVSDPATIKHISAIFSGCVKYDKVIDVVVEAFYAKEGSTILLSEKPVYIALTYIILFYLNHIGITNFKRLISTQHIVRMNKFLSLICDEHHLNSWMKEAWKRIYDHHFVEKNLLEPVLKWIPDLLDFNEFLQKKIANEKLKLTSEMEKEDAVPKLKNVTVAQPFDLTKPKPRSVPVPDLIPQVIKARSPPEVIYSSPKEKTFLEEKKEENRRKAQALLDEANANEFACAAASRTKPDKVLRRIEAIRMENETKHTYQPPRMNPTPKSTIRSEATIKLNTAAILREKKLCEDVEREQLTRIEELENGAFSDNQYRSWKAAVDQQHSEVVQAELERRLVQARLAREVAELAHAEAALDRKKVADNMREEGRQLLKQMMDKRKNEQDEMRRIVEQIFANRGKVAEAKAKLKEMKRKIVQEVSAESKEMIANALEEAEKEMKKRAELIANIRALEAVPIIRQKLFDRTEKAGYGFLEEMSLAELEERLALVKLEREKDIMEKQDVIVQEKRERQQKLTEAMDRIARHRMARSRVAAARKLKDAAQDGGTLISPSSAFPSVKLPKERQTSLNKITAQKRADVQERRAKLVEQMRATSSTSQQGSNVNTKMKIRNLMEEDHFKEHEKSQQKRDNAISHGFRKDWDSLRLMYS